MSLITSMLRSFRLSLVGHLLDQGWHAPKSLMDKNCRKPAFEGEKNTYKVFRTKRVRVWAWPLAFMKLLETVKKADRDLPFSVCPVKCWLLLHPVVRRGYCSCAVLLSGMAAGSSQPLCWLCKESLVKLVSSLASAGLSSNLDLQKLL